jgi:DNA-binding CsgD family transcriptional regulator
VRINEHDNPVLLDDFVTRLESAKTLSEMEHIFAESLKCIGVMYFTYHIAQAPEVSGRLPYVISTYPDCWIKRYLAENYLMEDPVVGEMARRALPFIWSEVIEPDDLSRRQRQLMGEAGEAGVCDGMTIPLNGHGFGAAVSLIPDPSSHGTELLQMNRHLLHLMAHYFHRKAGTVLLETSLKGNSSRRGTVLSPREREVLEWTARGKSAWEIAAILAISEKSIEFYAEGAKRKLQVFNRTHAVVKALMMGLISIG